ncbi:DsbE family thiol:disulfide interchange protein [Xanthobacter sp. DSM 14520]|uniref:DsbE family thiol:disulfide interchange protein n=1 Tax=Xanthobacter autotrophicus (strain ATCC BAA-1158 / Py2) TaxID=78245 RepID=UPI003728D028
MSTPDEMPAPTRPRRRLWLVALPLVLFLALAGLFFSRLETGGDPSRIPSALVGKAAPRIALPPLDGLKGPGGTPLPGIDLAALAGKPTLVNVWASWCGPCRDEHPVLMQLAKDGRFNLVGINYKDAPENARRFLGQYGLPYQAVGVDPKGRAAIDWGVYGVPETFVVARDGTIAHKFVGPLTTEAVNTTLLPLIARLSGN